MACAAALAVLDVMAEENLPERALVIGEWFQKRLAAVKDTYPLLVGEIRINGAMIAMEFIKNGDCEQPNTELTKKIIAKAKENSLILLPCGFYGNVIRFLPPLTIQEETVNEGMDCFDRLLAAVIE
ncbi:MAG: aminotransferase class III-fold pyridoxal phosphate-dependent enzyme [Gammaproteobacteria bacterium]